jgi:voltage-gated potassium channel
MKKGQQFWRDIAIALSSIWPNLAAFIGLMAGGAILLRLSGAYPQASWAGLLLDAFHMTILERVAEEGDSLVPILLSFLLPLGTVLLLGEGVMRIISIYLQKNNHQEEWDIMVAKTYRNHIVVCGVGELGKALVKRIHADHPEDKIVLVDLHPDLLSETDLPRGDITCLQSDMTSIETLKKANCHKARMVLLTSGSDTSNLEAAYKVMQLNPETETWVRLHHSGLAELMDLARKPNLHFFSPYQQAAEVIAGRLLQEEKET